MTLEEIISKLKQLNLPENAKDYCRELDFQSYQFILRRMEIVEQINDITGWKNSKKLDLYRYRRKDTSEFSEEGTTALWPQITQKQRQESEKTRQMVIAVLNRGTKSN